MDDDDEEGKEDDVFNKRFMMFVDEIKVGGAHLYDDSGNVSLGARFVFMTPWFG